jgi:hypothetical protein
MDYCASRMPRGAVSGEIIAGIEPIDGTLAAIERIASVGAFPTVCVFRPTAGSDMEAWPPPDYDDMRRVMAAVYDACRRHHVPIGLAPNIEVSLVVNPDDGAAGPAHAVDARLRGVAARVARRGAPGIPAAVASPAPDRIRLIDRGGTMVDREKVLTVLNPGDSPVPARAGRAAANAIVGLDDEWEDVSGREGEMGYNFSPDCCDICYLAQQVGARDQFRIFAAGNPAGAHNESLVQPILPAAPRLRIRIA